MLNLLIVSTFVAASFSGKVPTHSPTKRPAKAPTKSSTTSGYLYAQTNDATANSILVYTRTNGYLSNKRSFSTGGQGVASPGGLANQGAIAISADHKFLVTVNAGSNQITAFSIGTDGGLVKTSIVGSEGTFPVSVTIYNGIVFVLNQGLNSVVGNIAGFSLSSAGILYFIPGSTQTLSASTQTTLSQITPIQISFDPTGKWLAVTEKGTSLIDVYGVSSGGIPSAPVSSPSSGKAPLGFAIDSFGHVIVSEAATSAASSYSVDSTGKAAAISASVLNGGIAACWLALSTNQKYAYTANAASNTISSYQLTTSGQLYLYLDTAALTNLHPKDLVVTSDGFLYVLNSISQDIQVFKEQAGSLQWVQTVTGLPLGPTGLAGW